MKGRTNMRGVQESGNFQPVPAGPYKVKITQCADKYTQNGDPMIAITMEIIEGEHSGRLIFDNIIIPNEGSPAIKIKGRTKHFLHVIGEPYEDEFDWDSSRWLFKKCWVEVFIDEYQGKKNNKVSNYILEDGENLKDEVTDESLWEGESQEEMPAL